LHGTERGNALKLYGVSKFGKEASPRLATHLKDQRKVLKARHKMAPGQGYSFSFIFLIFDIPDSEHIKNAVILLNLSQVKYLSFYLKETYADIISKPKT